MNNYFDHKFFERPVLEVAEDLIGQTLVKDGKELIIKEIEAYDGPRDLACHASKGRTQRTQVLFGPAGHFYVYLCYGMHWMLNIVTGPKDYPAAILIRGAGDISGPGRLTRQLGIDRSYHNKIAVPETGLYFAPASQRSHKKLIQKTPRIGVDYAGPVWSKKPYRFVILT
jgi:DNA-3-methyladenine glycosylase